MFVCNGHTSHSVCLILSKNMDNVVLTMWRATERKDGDCSGVDSALITSEETLGSSSRGSPLLPGQSKPRAKPLQESIAQSSGRTTAPRRSMTQSQKVFVSFLVSTGWTSARSGRGSLPLWANKGSLRPTDWLNRACLDQSARRSDKCNESIDHKPLPWSDFDSFYVNNTQWCVWTPGSCFSEHVYIC